MPGSPPQRIVRRPSPLHSLPSLFYTALQLGGLVFIGWLAMQIMAGYWPEYTDKVIKKWITEHRRYIDFTAVALVFLCLLPFLLKLLASRLFSYTIKGDRISEMRTTLYTSDVAILFKDLDHLCLKRYFWDMVFGTATITVETVGSSQSEMVLRNVPKFREFYQAIKDRSRSG